MELHGERIIPAPVETTWACLNDPEVLKACITGCESLERTADDAFVTKVAVKVGPVNARFTGNLKLQNVQPPTSYTILFEGQGGVAGFGKGSADVSLVPEGTGQTKLGYAAQAQVGGKLAQIGSRLVDAAAAKIAEDFFKAFESEVQARVAPPSAEPAEAPLAEPAPIEAAPLATTASTSWGWWVVGAIVAVALLYFVFR
jgi:carbon monoxide dehydrogenase subunit G